MNTTKLESHGAVAGQVERGVRPKVYVCGACGKRSRDRCGDSAIDGGWDESCMLNAVLAYEDSLTMRGGRVASIAEGGVAEALPAPRQPPDWAAILAAPIDPELLAEAEKTLAALRAAASGPNGAVKRLAPAQEMTMTTDLPGASPVDQPVGRLEPARTDVDAPVCPWCDRQGWDTCQHYDDTRTCTQAWGAR